MTKRERYDSVIEMIVKLHIKELEELKDATIERCAGVAEKYEYRISAGDIASAIRALKK